MLSKWATKAKLGDYGWLIKKELRRLDVKELSETGEVLTILQGMYRDELDRRGITSDNP